MKAIKEQRKKAVVAMSKVAIKKEKKNEDGVKLKDTGVSFDKKEGMIKVTD